MSISGYPFSITSETIIHLRNGETELEADYTFYDEDDSGEYHSEAFAVFRIEFGTEEVIGRQKVTLFHLAPSQAVRIAAKLMQYSDQSQNREIKSGKLKVAEDV
jgi:hypothetical protein